MDTSQKGYPHQPRESISEWMSLSLDNPLISARSRQRQIRLSATLPKMHGLRDPIPAHPFPDIEIRYLHSRYQAFRNCKYPAGMNN
jgi:hypothetical protein